MNLLRFVQTPIEDRNLPFPETRVRSGELLRASQQGQLVHHLSDKGLRMIFPPSTLPPWKRILFHEIHPFFLLAGILDLNWILNGIISSSVDLEHKVFNPLLHPPLLCGFLSFSLNKYLK